MSDAAKAAGRLDQLFAFLLEAEKLKSVTRATPVHDGSRRENSAEHSWTLALYALVLAEEAAPGVDPLRAVKMLLIHDLVEIDVGDVPLHSADGQAHGAPEIQQAKAEAARRIFGLLPAAQGAEFLALWQEFEANQTPDAIFAKSLDRTQPLVQNLASNGAGWITYGVTYDNITSRVGAKIARGLPAVWDALHRRVRAFFGLD